MFKWVYFLTKLNMSSKKYEKQLEQFTEDFNHLMSDLHDYMSIKYPGILKKAKQQKRKRDLPVKSKCKLINVNGYYKVRCYHIEPPKVSDRKRRGKRLADKVIEKKIINGETMAKWGDQWLPVCDGSGYPYVEGCYHDMSNWTSGSHQCIIENPASPNIANGSLYTCGFLW